MKLIDADALVIRLIDEGQEHSSEYGFKLGDMIRFTPSQVGVIAGKMPTVGATPEGHWIEDRLYQQAVARIKFGDAQGARTLLIGECGTAGIVEQVWWMWNEKHLVSVW